MTAKRKTGKDYRKELSELNDKERRLKAVVCQRLLELTKEHPDIDLPTSRAGGLKCKEISHPWIIQETTTDAVIEYIEAIELHLANVHPHKQTAIEF